MSFSRSGRPFSESQRALPVSASSCLLFLTPGSYKRHFLRLHWLSYRSSCVRLEAGNPRRPPLPSAFAGSLVLLFAIASQVSTDTECSRVLLGSLSCDCSEVIAVFDRRIWRIISGEVSVSMQPWASFTLISVMRCDLHWESEQKWDISIGNINDDYW